jgi:uncharacterized protein
MAPAEGDAGSAATVAVEVCYSPRAGVVERVALRLPAGSTLAQALEASGLAARYPEVPTLECGIWGHREPPGTVLRERDRVEVWRRCRWTRRRHGASATRARAARRGRLAECAALRRESLVAVR